MKKLSYQRPTIWDISRNWDSDYQTELNHTERGWVRFMLSPELQESHRTWWSN